MSGALDAREADRARRAARWGLRRWQLRYLRALERQLLDRLMILTLAVALAISVEPVLFGAFALIALLNVVDTAGEHVREWRRGRQGEVTPE